MAKAAKRKIRAASLSKKRASKAKKKKTAAKAGTSASARTRKASAKTSERTAGVKRPAARAVATRGGTTREDTSKDMDGGYTTCDGTCKDPKPRQDPGDPMGEPKIWCDVKCKGEVGKDCRCRLYSYPTPKKGDPIPDMKDWKKEKDTKIVPEDGKTYKCVCVNK